MSIMPSGMLSKHILDPSNELFQDSGAINSDLKKRKKKKPEGFFLELTSALPQDK